MIDSVRVATRMSFEFGEWLCSEEDMLLPQGHKLRSRERAHKHTGAQTPKSAQQCTHTGINAHTHAPMHAHTRARTHTSAYTHTNTCACARTHTRSLLYVAKNDGILL